jgi:uncharacterized protein (DUF1499 family)
MKTPRIGAYLVGIALAIGLTVAVSEMTAPAEPIDFAAMSKPSLPNAWLICPTGLCVSENAVSPVFAIPAAELRGRWDAMIALQPRVERARDDPDGLGGTWVQSTATLGFRDRINVRFIDVPEGGSTLAVFSRSGIGLYDFGVNRRRLEEWLAALAALV